MNFKTKTASRTLWSATLIALLGISGTLSLAAAQAVNALPRTESQTPKADADHTRNMNLDPVKTFYLKASSGVNDANETAGALRQMFDPSTRIYLLSSINAIVMRGTPESLVTAQKILDEIDRPKKIYRLTYTITESDSGKRLGIQHFSLALVPGGRTTLKNGSKVPVATSSFSSSNSPQQTQFTYLDVGLNFDASLDEASNGFKLKSKVEQSSATEEKLIFGVQEPLVRQSVLEGTSFLTLGKPLMLGSLDIAGSTRHLDIEVTVEPVN
jgi:hypothetical protein